MKPAKASVSDSIPNHGMRICGRTIGLDRGGDRCIPVVNPYTGECIATVPKATLAPSCRAAGAMCLEVPGDDGNGQ